MTGRISHLPILSAFLLAAMTALPAAAASDRQIQQSIAFDQRIGTRVPADLHFTDAEGNEVRLGRFLGGKPVVLMLAWYNCPNICPIALDGLAQSLGQLSFTPGRDYRVVTVSIDPREGAPGARKTRAELVTRNGDGPKSWHVLTGGADAIRRLADAVGFRYRYDAGKKQYAHPAGIVLLDPQGRVARYLFGVRFPVRDLGLGLVESGRGELGSPVDRLVLRCHSFDPQTGRYNLAVMNLLRVAGGGFTLLLLGVVGWWWLKERRASAYSNRSNGDTGRDGRTG